MKLKKKVKRNIFIVAIVLVIILLGVIILPKVLKNDKEEIQETKIVSKIDDYGYNLKETKSKVYKEKFEELKKILQEDKVDEEKYVSKIAEMYIYDFYSLKDKAAKTDVGGVDFVHEYATENFLKIAQDTYYKYVESNIYNERKQELPEVDEITIGEITQTAFGYGDANDEKAYVVNVTWTYTEPTYASYQKSAKLIFVHNDKKLCLVESK